MSFRKILVPYDGSQFTDKALENAIGIAKLSRADTQIILLHVAPHIPILLTFERPVYSAKTGKSIPLTQYIQELSEEMEENVSKMSEEERQKYADYDVKIDTISLNGYSPEKIIGICKQ